jgi:DNA mismatch repair protein MutS
VVRAAKKHLAKLEKETASRSPQGDLFSVMKKAQPEPHPALDMLRQADPDSLSPKEALELLYQLRKLTDQKQ